MQYSRPTKILVEEHEVISAVLDALEAVAARPDHDENFPAEFYRKAFDFFPTFADRCHHAKEEQHLFPLLEARGIPRDGGPIGCMLSEHEQGREHVRAVLGALDAAAAGDRSARQTVRERATAYAALLRQHIDKENNVLFPFGDQVLAAGDRSELRRRFDEAERTAVAPGTHGRCVALAGELRRMAGLPPARAEVGHCCAQDE